MPKNTWKIQRSILFEMDTIFSLVNDYLPLASLSDSINQLVDSIPQEMVQELRKMLGDQKQYFGFLFAAGFSARTEFEDDYALATMPIRKMSRWRQLLSTFFSANWSAKNFLKSGSMLSFQTQNAWIGKTPLPIQPGTVRE